MASAGHHCPNCHEAVKPDWSLCPQCGYQKPASPGQIRCRVCGRSAAGLLRACPHCGAYLAPKPLPILQVSLGAILLIGLIFGGIWLRQRLSGPVGRLALLVNPPTPTATATVTPTPSPTFTLTPTSTPSPTGTPTPQPTRTLTPTPSRTATPQVTETPLGAPTATSTPTPSPTSTPRFDRPVLLGPDDGKLFGREEEVVLRWENMGPLAPNEWYAVRLTWQQDGQLSFGGHNLKDNFWVVPPDRYWGLADEFSGRRYEWFVFIEEITTDQNGQEIGQPVSEASERSTFLWQE